MDASPILAIQADVRQRTLTLSYIPLPSPTGRGRGDSRVSGWGVGEVRGGRIAAGEVTYFPSGERSEVGAFSLSLDFPT